MFIAGILMKLKSCGGICSLEYVVQTSDKCLDFAYCVIYLYPARYHTVRAKSLLPYFVSLFTGMSLGFHSGHTDCKPFVVNII